MFDTELRKNLLQVPKQEDGTFRGRDDTRTDIRIVRVEISFDARGHFRR